MNTRTKRLVLPILLLLLLTTPLLAQSTNQEDITTDKLDVLLLPLTADELKVKAEAWQKLVQARLQAVGAAKLAGQPTDEAMAAQTAAVERYELVLAAWEAKGGDPAAHAQWLEVATNVEVEIPKDAGAVVTFVTDWVTSPTGGIALGINILLFIATLIVFKILSGVLGGVTRKAVTTLKNTSELLRNFFVNVVKKLTMIIGLIVALTFLGVDVGPFVAAIGAVGFIIAFALQGTLSNFASGIMILLYRPYDIGEVVSVGGVTGKVDAMSLVSTTVRSPDNQVVIIPNGKIWGDVITNVTGEKTRRVDMVMGIGYSDDIAKAEKVLNEILTAHPKVLDEPAPVVMVHELADSSVNFVVRPWSLTGDYWDVYWDVTRQVKERFDAEGIGIPYPHSEVYVHQVEG